MMQQDLAECALPLKSQKTAAKGTSRIPVTCRQRNPFIPRFLFGTVILTILSLLYLEIDWIKMFFRIPEIGVVFWELAHLDFSNMDLIASSLIETISIAVLSLLYSLVLGIFFGMLAARNIFRIPALSVFTQSFFTFLRAVPTPVWVLLMLVCLGMGPEAGMRLETNFSECAILGMVGAGGVGYVISNSLQGYDYGTAGVAILLVFLVAYFIERIFVRIKKKFY